MISDSSESADNEARLRRGLHVLTAAAFLVRALFLLLEPETQPVADERTWIDWATLNLVTPKVSFSPFRTHLIFYPPVYPYFIAALFSAFGTLEAVKWAQVLVTSLLVPAVGRVGAIAFGPSAGLIAAAITAFYPELVWFSAHFWSESLFMVFLWWSIERLLVADVRHASSAAAVGGLLWGLAILTRETALYFTPIAALWLGTDRRHSGAPLRGAVFLLTALVTVSPWTYRNWVVFGAFVPVSTAGGLNLYQGNTRLTRQEVYDRIDAVKGRIEQDRFARRMGLEAIWERQPYWIFEKLRDEMPNFWEADSLALIHIKRGAYGPVRPVFAAAAALVVLLPFAAWLSLLVFGAAVLPFARHAMFIVLFLIYYNAIHVVTHGFARYRLPVLPVVFITAAATLAWARSRAVGRIGRRRKALAAFLGLALGASVLPTLKRNWEHPAFGFADPGEAAGDEPARP